MTQNGINIDKIRLYIGNTGRIKKSSKFQIWFWSRESEKPIFTIFPEIFTRKIRNTGISSETTESRVRRRRPGSLEWDGGAPLRSAIALRTGILIGPLHGRCSSDMFDDPDDAVYLCARAPSSHPRYQGAVVSPEIPGIVVSFEIPRCPDFFRKKIWTNRKHRFLGFLGPK